MENIKEFLKRNPNIKEIHFDEEGKWLYSKAPNHVIAKTMTREEILGKDDKSTEKKSAKENGGKDDKSTEKKSAKENGGKDDKSTEKK